MKTRQRCELRPPPLERAPLGALRMPPPCGAEGRLNPPEGPILGRGEPNPPGAGAGPAAGPNDARLLIMGGAILTGCDPVPKAALGFWKPCARTAGALLKPLPTPVPNPLPKPCPPLGTFGARDTPEVAGSILRQPPVLGVPAGDPFETPLLKPLENPGERVPANVGEE